MGDIKGSTHHRSAKPGDSVLKDNDWTTRGARLNVSEEEVRSLTDAHRKDMDFLMSRNVMDFSLLVGVADVGDHSRMSAASLPPGCWVSEEKKQVYLLGIVDFLVDYGVRKR